MSKPSLLQRLVPSASSAKIEERLLKAREAVTEAERRYRAAALDGVTSGQDSSPAEYSADEALTKARADVSRLEAALVEAQARERAQASSALEAQQAAEDAKVQAAFDSWAVAAKVHHYAGVTTPYKRMSRKALIRSYLQTSPAALDLPDQKTGVGAGAGSGFVGPG